MLKNSRLIIIFLILIIFISIIFIKLFIIQVFNKERYIELAEKNRVKKFTEIAPRGDIISSDGKVIAMNKPYYSLYADLNNLSTDSKTLSIISSLIDISMDSLNSLIKLSKIYKENEICLKTNLDIIKVSFIEENANKFLGIYVKQEPRRFYPYNFLYAHSIGYIGNMNKEEYEKYKQEGYRYNDFIGKTGVEKYYENFLRGKDGIKYYEVDARCRKIKELENNKSFDKEKGKDIYVSINHKLQVYADSLFKDYESGVVIVMDTDGRILTMYSKPSFDPNLFIYGMNNDVWNFLNRNALSPFLNRSVAGLYPPASIFKLLIALIGLQTEKVEKDTYFQSCNGSILIAGKLFKCWKNHGELDLYNAIVQSCDVYFYQLGLKISLENFSKYAKQTMFGQETHIDLYEESTGLIPDDKYLNKKYGKKQWGLGQMANLSIGQGDLLVTPLQIAVFTNTIINEGKVIKPHIVDSIKNKNEIIKHNDKEILFTLPFNKEYYKLIKNAMRDVVNSDKGTAKNVSLNRGVLSGKTGTAENPHGETHSWFSGFYPFNKPEIIITVIVENGGHGSGPAAQITHDIVKFYMEMKNADKK